jgi:hypothetical protein
MNILAMIEYEIKKQYLPSQYHTKQLRACWTQIINVLRELLNELNELTSKKTEAYSKLTRLNLVGGTTETIISNSMLQTRQWFEETLENLKK